MIATSQSATALGENALCGPCHTYIRCAETSHRQDDVPARITSVTQFSKVVNGVRRDPRKREALRSHCSIFDSMFQLKQNRCATPWV
jgi:hypothetical protein